MKLVDLVEEVSLDFIAFEKDPKKAKELHDYAQESQAWASFDYDAPARHTINSLEQNSDQNFVVFKHAKIKEDEFRTYVEGSPVGMMILDHPFTKMDLTAVRKFLKQHSLSPIVEPY